MVKHTKIKLLKCSYGHTNVEHSICHRWIKKDLQEKKSFVIPIETIKSDKRKEINVRKNAIGSKIIKCYVRNCGDTSNKKVYITTHERISLNKEGSHKYSILKCNHCEFKK